MFNLWKIIILHDYNFCVSIYMLYLIFFNFSIVTKKTQISQLGISVVVSVVHSLSQVQPCATPWTAGHQASLSFTISQSLLRLMSIESVMPSKHLILCHPLFFLPSVLPRLRVFSNESALWIRWPKFWSFGFSISSVQLSSVAQSCPTLCDPMDWSTPGFPPSPTPRVYSNSCPLSKW